MVRLERNRLREELRRVGESLTELKEIYLAGGSSLVFYDLKESTRDIDLVVEKDDELSPLMKTLRELEYTELSRGEVSRFGLPNPSKPKDFLWFIDLSAERLGRVKLSDGMRERSRQINLGRVTYLALHPTDVLLTKIDIITKDWASDDIGDFKRVVESRFFNQDALFAELDSQPEGGEMKEKFKQIGETIFGGES